MVISRVPPPQDGSKPRTSSLLAIILVVGLALGIWLLNGREPGTSTGAPEPDESSGLPVVALADLPAEAADTLDLIDAGGPYPEDEDGATFRNDEGLLPDRERGYYEEFTVPTPGSDDRGARRIIVGAEGELFWTDDHYASFARIAR